MKTEAHTITDVRLGEIRARCDAAAPGPWEWDMTDGSMLVLMSALDESVLVCAPCAACRARGINCSEPNKANGEFIAEARQDVIDLLAEIERLKAIVERHGGHT